MPPEFTPIATRVLEVDGRPGFHIRLGRPYFDAGHNAWACEFEVEGPVTKRRRAMVGNDAVQALLNAIYTASVWVEISAENKAGRLSWDGEEQHFGLPGPDAGPDADPEIQRLRRLGWGIPPEP